MSGDIFGYYSEGPGVVSRQLRGGGQGCGHPSFGAEDARLPQRRSTQPQMWTAPGARGPGAHVPRAVSQGHFSTSDGGRQGDADARGSTAREGPGPAGRGPGTVVARGAMPAARFSPLGRASSKPRSKRPGSVGACRAAGGSRARCRPCGRFAVQTTGGRSGGTVFGGAQPSGLHFAWEPCVLSDRTGATGCSAASLSLLDSATATRFGGTRDLGRSLCEGGQDTPSCSEERQADGYSPFVRHISVRAQCQTVRRGCCRAPPTPAWGVARSTRHP